MDEKETTKADAKEIIYPVRLTEFDDESGHYFMADTPDLPGMLTEGATISEVTKYAHEALSVYLYGETNYPYPTNPEDWQLKANQSVIYVKTEVKFEPQDNRIISSFDLNQILNAFRYDLFEKQLYLEQVNVEMGPKEALLAEKYNNGFKDAYKVLRHWLEYWMADPNDEQTTLTFPLIVTEMDDETGHYFFLSSPDLKGMHTHGETIFEANEMAHDALYGCLEAWFDLHGKWPKQTDYRDWILESNQMLMFVTVEVTESGINEAAYNEFLEEMGKAKTSQGYPLEEVKKEVSFGALASSDSVSTSDEDIMSSVFDDLKEIDLEEPLPLFRVQMVEDDDGSYFTDNILMPEMIGFGETKELALISFKEGIIMFCKWYRTDFEDMLKAPNRKHQWSIAAKILMYLEIYGNVDGLVEVVDKI
jgi:predicted RNase H-like HicB family nuclease